ncbi:MAG TPA: nucleotide exchange factor GrpE [Candidatus Thermoplasmatota archaeon]|nr:nucleotide exchange factor GrpE [Candidatus Thermoplasmatota archaeon]
MPEDARVAEQQDTAQAEAKKEDAAPPPPASPDAKDERVAAAEAREKELIDRLARLQADFENYRRRSREDVAQAKSAGKLDLVKSLLPVLDNLDRALAHTKDEGLQLLARQLRDTLTNAGVVLLEPLGEAFDAKVHEAIAQEAREGAKAGTVLTVVEKGYVLDGKLVRPARVVVAA